MNFLNVFSDREKAIIIWFCILFIWTLAHKSVRDNLKEPVLAILKILFSAKMGIPLLLMGVYVSLVVFMAYTFRIWDVSVLKDTMLWFFGVACIMFVNAGKAGQDSKYFKDVALDNLKFSVLLGFIINLYVFNLFIELLLVPILFLVTAMLVIADKKKEYARVKKLFNGFLVIIGLAMLTFALVHVFGDFKDFATIENLKTFLWPPLLTFAFLPFIYFLAVYARYESLFVSVDIWKRDQKELATFIKWRLFWKCLLNLNKLNRVFKKCALELMSAKDELEVTTVMHQFKNR